MNALELMNPAHFFMEIGQESLKVFNGNAGLELPLERQADGRLTDACKNELTLQLQGFINRKSWQPRARVFCAISARGVSLRRLSLPAASKEELRRLLPLQIENEFPLPPQQLAWGWQPLRETATRPNGSNDKQDLLVVAVKKDSLEEFAAILSRCGASPVFTLGALARSYFCPQPPGPYSVLAVERNYSELIFIEGGVPIAVRVLPWGRENLANLRYAASGNGQKDEAGLLNPPNPAASFGGTGSQRPDSAPADALDPLVRLLNAQAVGRKVYLTGIGDLHSDFDFATQLAQRLGNGVECQTADLAPGKSGSVAILGLQKVVSQEAGWPPLALDLKQTNGKVTVARQAPLKWIAIAAGLLLLALILPYAEALTLKSHLAKKLAATKTDQGRLATIDRELDFLQYLQQNEPPYIDALLALAKAAPPGTRFDAVSMNRRGDVSLRGALQNGQQVADLRSKLIDSGFFESVSIEEQAPGQNQKVNVRMSAQWKPLGSRTTPTLEPGRAAGEQKRPASRVTPGAPPPSASPSQPAKSLAPKTPKE